MLLQNFSHVFTLVSPATPDEQRAPSPPPSCKCCPLAAPPADVGNEASENPPPAADCLPPLEPAPVPSAALAPGKAAGWPPLSLATALQKPQALHLHDSQCRSLKFGSQKSWQSSILESSGRNESQGTPSRQ